MWSYLGISCLSGYACFPRPSCLLTSAEHTDINIENIYNLHVSVSALSLCLLPAMVKYSSSFTSSLFLVTRVCSSSYRRPSHNHLHLALSSQRLSLSLLIRCSSPPRPGQHLGPCAVDWSWAPLLLDDFIYSSSLDGGVLRLVGLLSGLQAHPSAVGETLCRGRALDYQLASSGSPEASVTRWLEGGGGTQHVKHCTRWPHLLPRRSASPVYAFKLITAITKWLFWQHRMPTCQAANSRGLMLLWGLFNINDNNITFGNHL